MEQTTTNPSQDDSNDVAEVVQWTADIIAGSPQLQFMMESFCGMFNDRHTRDTVAEMLDTISTWAILEGATAAQGEGMPRALQQRKDH